MSLPPTMAPVTPRSHEICATTTGRTPDVEPVVLDLQPGELVDILWARLDRV